MWSLEWRGDTLWVYDTVMYCTVLYLQWLSFGLYRDNSDQLRVLTLRLRIREERIICTQTDIYIQERDI